MRLRVLALAAPLLLLACSRNPGGSSSGGTSSSGAASSTSTSGTTASSGSGSASSGSSGSGGTTGPSCACPQVACGDSCVNLSNDAQNCGACGFTCNGPCGFTTCLNGTCQPPPYYSCTSGATSTGSGGASSGGSSGSSGSSGTCNNSCATSSDCPGGYTCEPPAITSTTTSGGNPGNSCQPCEWPMLVCNGQCVHGDQVDNCGACGNACGDFQACVNGQCTCKTHDDGCSQGCGCLGNQQLCGDLCSDLQTDRAHCGSCGTACAPNQACVGGQCTPGDGGAPRDAFNVTFLPVPGNVPGIGAGDLNGDGHPDLVVATEYSTTDSGVGPGQLLSALNDGNGAFGPLAAVPATSESVALADFNGDGKLDAVIADYGDQYLELFYGDGAGGFTAGPIVFTPSEPELVRVADFNHDGHPDLFVEGLNYANLTDLYEFDVFLNNGNGTFGTAVRTTGAASLGSFYRAQDGVVADLDGDGFADVAASGWLFRGVGDGTFQPALALGAGVATTSADLDGDGKLDLVLLGGGDPADGCTLDAVRVRRGLGDGGFAAADVYAMPEWPRLAAAGKFTGGARKDLAVIFGGFYSGEDDYALLLVNDGTGHFALDLQRYDLGDGGYPVQAVPADLNGDGRDDLLVPQLYKSRIAILRTR